MIEINPFSSFMTFYVFNDNDGVFVLFLRGELLVKQTVKIKHR